LGGILAISSVTENSMERRRSMQGKLRAQKTQARPYWTASSAVFNKKFFACVPSPAHFKN
jgi:hypothetical protein